MNILSNSVEVVCSIIRINSSQLAITNENTQRRNRINLGLSVDFVGARKADKIGPYVFQSGKEKINYADQRQPVDMS